MLPRGGASRSFVLVVLILFCIPLMAQDGLAVGSQAPDFDLPALDGARVALTSFLNKNIVVLHFWKLR